MEDCIGHKKIMATGNSQIEKLCDCILRIVTNERQAHGRARPFSFAGIAVSRELSFQCDKATGMSQFRQLLVLYLFLSMDD